jgi:uncharacterized repeat protein (TIGR03809 family)
MPAVQGGYRLDEISRKWRDLADRRLAYFTELYRSGRWKHYYSQDEFVARMRDVVKAAKVWSHLADRTAAEQILAEQPAIRDDRMRPAA